MSDDAPPRVVRRLSVGLIRKAADELDQLALKTGVGRASLINRAISLYAFVQATTERGHHLLTRNPDTGETERVHFVELP